MVLYCTLHTHKAQLWSKARLTYPQKVQHTHPRSERWRPEFPQRWSWRTLPHGQHTQSLSAWVVQKEQLSLKWLWWRKKKFRPNSPESGTEVLFKGNICYKATTARALTSAFYNTVLEHVRSVAPTVAVVSAGMPRMHCHHPRLFIKGIAHLTNDDKNPSLRGCF